MAEKSKETLTSNLAGWFKEEAGVVLNNDRLYDKGKREKVIARLCKEKGLSQQEAEREVDKFIGDADAMK